VKKGASIGIDLGTTNSVGARMVGTHPEVIEDAHGHARVPSIVAWTSGGGQAGQFKIGESAKPVMITDPVNTIYGIKRLLGRPYDSKPAHDARERMAYPIEKADDGGCVIRIGGQKLTPVDVSALILAAIREAAERVMKEPVGQSVITVPAHFNNAQRQLTLEAAKQAGLNCQRLVNEPTAAALAYGYKKDFNKTYVVFDLGGGTFDVTVLRLENKVYEVLATYGDTYLGGEDFDHLLLGYLAEEFYKKTDLNLYEDKLALQRVKFEAEKAKCDLSFRDTTTVAVQQVMNGKDLTVQVTRDRLERLTSELVFRTIQLVGATVTDAGLKIADIDDVILVGGQTRMPMIRRGLVDLFEKEPVRGVHPDQVVAVGAAIQAARLDDPEFDTSVLVDVIPFGYGIEPDDASYEGIFGKYEKVPASFDKLFRPARAGADTISFVLRHGNAPDPRDNEFLGYYVFKGIPDGPERDVQVVFRLDASANLAVTAKMAKSGQALFLSIQDFGQMLRYQLNERRLGEQEALAKRTWWERWFGWLMFWRHARGT
jgi:molecular chaperone DnaK